MAILNVIYTILSISSVVVGENQSFIDNSANYKILRTHSTHHAVDTVESNDLTSAQLFTVRKAGKNSIGVAILVLLGLCNTIIGHPWTAWAILLKSKSGAILLQYYFTQR